MFNFKILSHWAEVRPEELAYVDEMYSVSFAQLNSDTRKIANFLAQSGISRGDLVCTILPSYMEWVFTLALHLLGAATMSRSRVTPFDSANQPLWVISPKEHPQINKDKTLIINETIFNRILIGSEISLAPGYKNGEALARIFSTSGTSGTPKSIALYVSQLSNLPANKSGQDFISAKNVLGLYPFAAFQSYTRAIKALAKGETFFGYAKFGPKILEILVEHQISAILGSPAQVSSFLTIQKEAGIELPNISAIVMGGSAPSIQLISRIREQLNCSVFNAYGSTEAGNVTIREITDGISGGALINSSADVQIVDENDLVLPLMQTGRIRYKKPGMATSYYKNPVASAEFFKDGYFYPGDLGYIDEAGLLVLCGRVNEVINLGGVKINPEKVDEVALAQLGVLDCASFAVSDASGVEQLGIALVTDGDFDLELFTKAMASDCVAVPSVIKQVGAIARNDNGKVVRGDLSAQISTFKGDNPG